MAKQCACSGQTNGRRAWKSCKKPMRRMWKIQRRWQTLSAQACLWANRHHAISGKPSISYQGNILPTVGRIYILPWLTSLDWEDSSSFHILPFMTRWRICKGAFIARQSKSAWPLYPVASHDKMHDCTTDVAMISEICGCCSQLKTVAPNHHAIQNLQTAEESFNKAASAYWP